MGVLWYGEGIPRAWRPAGGEASLGEIWEAALEHDFLVKSSISAQSALERAYDRRNEQIAALTGEKLDNPMRMRGWAGVDAQAKARTRGDTRSPTEIAIGEWEGQVRDLAARKPDVAAQIMPARTVADDAIALADDARQRFERIAGSRDGAGKWLTIFGAGIVGVARDPLQLSMAAIGGGVGGARTLAGRILTTAASEAAINAATEVAISRATADWRAKVGDDASWEQTWRDAAFAGLLGAGIGGAGRSLAELLSRGGRAESQALAAGLDNAPPALRSELEARLPEASAALRETLPPAARGALDQAEQIAHLDGTRPVAASAEHHDVTVAAAGRAAQVPESFAGFAPDPAQVERVTATITGPAPAKPAKEPPSLLEFLKARGGVLDDKGELAAIGAGRLAEKQRGKPDRRVSLDYAREAAEEAGYIGRAGEAQVTTIADLLDAIDTELRGTKVFSREDQSAVATFADFEVERARLEGLVAEVIGHAGPAVDDRLVLEAAELALRDGIDAFDAVESVLTRAEQAGRVDTATAGDFRSWFGDSQVVDDAGAPLVVYHGSVLDFVDFRPGRDGAGTPTGIFFTPDPAVAALYASSANGIGGNVRPVYLNARNLQTVDFGGAAKTPDGRTRFRVVQDARAAGFDGVRLANTEDAGGVQDQFVVFEPQQVRSRFSGPPSRSGEPLPGWSDAELEAASAARGAEPAAENGSTFDDPAIADADESLSITPADIELYRELEIPGDDGPVSLEAYMADIALTEDLAATLKACRI